MATATYRRSDTRRLSESSSSCALRRLTNAHAAWLIGDREEPPARSWFDRFRRRRGR
jgi:hypothetical protein